MGLMQPNNTSRVQRYHEADVVMFRVVITCGMNSHGCKNPSRHPVQPLPFVDKESSEMCRNVVGHTTTGSNNQGQSQIQVSCLSNHTVCHTCHSLPCATVALIRSPSSPTAGNSYQKEGEENHALGIGPLLLTICMHNKSASHHSGCLY